MEKTVLQEVVVAHWKVITADSAKLIFKPSGNKKLCLELWKSNDKSGYWKADKPARQQ